jgi:hypothetical protein
MDLLHIVFTKPHHLYTLHDVLWGLRAFPQGVFIREVGAIKFIAHYANLLNNFFKKSTALSISSSISTQSSTPVHHFKKLIKQFICAAFNTESRKYASLSN